jgi:nitronate monooxygenase
MNTISYPYGFDWRLHTPLVDLLGCRVPVLCAGMGGVSRYELAAAVSAAGGLGCLGMVREAPEFIRDQVTRLRASTARPFAVNIIPAATDSLLLAEQVACIIELKVPMVCLFWDVIAEVIACFQKSGVLVMHQVGSIAAAKQAFEASVDVLIAQGVEAGGHVMGNVGGFALTSEIAAISPVPVVAAGGIGTGHAMAAAMNLGAQGVWCGSAFLATLESNAHDYHKERLIQASATDTVYTKRYHINWPMKAPVRVLRNSVTESPDHAIDDNDQNAPIARQDGRAVVLYSTDSPLKGAEGELEKMALYAGESCGQIHELCSAAERLHQLVAQARATFDRWPNTPDFDSPDADPVDFASPPCLLPDVAAEYQGYLSVAETRARFDRFGHAVLSGMRLSSRSMQKAGDEEWRKRIGRFHSCGAKMLQDLSRGLPGPDLFEGQWDEPEIEKDTPGLEPEDWILALRKRWQAAGETAGSDLQRLHPDAREAVRRALKRLRNAIAESDAC